MKYDEMYPDTEAGEEGTAGLMRLEDPQPCAKCEEPTRWMCSHINLLACSMDCHHALTQTWLEEQRDKWIDESLVDHEDQDLLRRQHNKTIARLVEWSQSEQLALFYIDVPRSFPFEGEVPVVPIKGIQWAEVLKMVSAPVEESIAGKVATVVVQDDVELPVMELHDLMDTVDPLGDEDEADVPEDEKVWMGNDLPYKEGSEESRDPIDLKAFADSLEDDNDN